MNQAHNTIDGAMTEIDRLRKILKQRKTKQVYGIEERSLIKATSLAWFHNHRSTVASVVSDDSIKSVDDLYKEILLASDRASVRLTYDGLLKSARNELSKIRAQAVTQYSSTSIQGTESASPNFDPLITGSQMQEILKNRWVECVNCLSASAPLAAIVMMGGLLEALLLARINKETNKALIFKAKVAPKDKKTGNPLVLSDWTLKNYIEIAYELKWISHSAKDVGAILRDYRNYIHPYKELSHGIVLNVNDAKLLWEIAKNITRQIIVS